MWLAVKDALVFEWNVTILLLRLAKKGALGRVVPIDYQN